VIISIYLTIYWLMLILRRCTKLESSFHLEEEQDCALEMILLSWKSQCSFTTFSSIMSKYFLPLFTTHVNFFPHTQYIVEAKYASYHTNIHNDCTHILQLFRIKFKFRLLRLQGQTFIIKLFLVNIEHY